MYKYICFELYVEETIQNMEMVRSKHNSTENKSNRAKYLASSENQSFFEERF